MKSCPSCNSGNTKGLYRNLYDKSYFVEGSFSLIQCKSCGLEFLHPKLNEKELAKYYPEDEYYSFYDYNSLALLYHKLSALYFSKRSKAINFFLSPFDSLLYTYFINPGSSVLEIGCGNGMKLEIYKNYGLQTAGLEPYGPQLTEKERFLGIKRESIDEANYKENAFDYIILKEVLEHVPDQLNVLKKCYFWLKPRGKLIITVPDTKSLWRKIFKKSWFGYDVPRHLYNYSRDNIKLILNRSGFQKIKIRNYDTPYMLDGSLKFYLTKNRKRNKIAEKIIFSNASKLIFTPISLIASHLNLGSLMEVECTK